MPDLAFFINTSKDGQESIIVFYSGIHYIINCAQHDKPQSMLATTIPPTSSIPIKSFPEANLVQSNLASFIHNKSIPPPISSPIHTNGIHGPTSSEIASIFANSVPPLVNSSWISSPIPNPPPPYKP
ncbi:hypothetical protein O181_089504 [Austropuccinia psidii MF-1]|uniref:Uncharacterized protein n=1 Tax=Austropuccinia psidii MF-1 TaxID=1389203 RepID=A0A9Q3ITR6_9BASI|nr:hypothetical protein [Austropuccinia psidii MF-1]